MSQDYLSTSDEIAKRSTANRARRSLMAAELSSILSLTEESIHNRTLSICQKYIALTTKKEITRTSKPKTPPLGQHTEVQHSPKYDDRTNNNIRSSLTTPIQDAEDTVAHSETSKSWTSFNLVSKLFRVLSLVCIINAICLTSLNAWIMAGGFVCLALVLLDISRSAPVRLSRKLALGTCLALMVAAAPITANNLTSGLRVIGDQVISEGPESLSYLSRFSLWWSTIWMSAGGVAYGAPYTVIEQVLMFWPGEKQRLWNSDFPAKSFKVQNLIVEAKNSAGTTNSSHEGELIWQSYCQDNCDVGLALNGGTLTVDITDQGKRCTATARVNVSYKPQYRSSTILMYGEYHLSIDQAAYWALQELGWLFPYTLRYRWKC